MHSVYAEQAKSFNLLVSNVLSKTTFNNQTGRNQGAI